MHDPAVFRSLHAAHFHAEPAIFVAPGRVNLIGEHTDYAEGFVMPAAIDFATLAGISPRNDGKIVIYSENYGEEREFEAAALPAKASQHWSDYPMGVVSILSRRRPPDSRLQPQPVERCAAGIGAVEFRGACSCHGAGRPVAYRGQLSGPGVGAPLPARRKRVCGRQLRHHGPVHFRQRPEDHALLLDCRDLSFRLAPIPAHMALVIANTMVKHSVVGGDYKTRRAEVGSGLRRNRQSPAERDLPARRDVEDLEKWGHEMAPKSLDAGAPHHQ